MISELDLEHMDDLEDENASLHGRITFLEDENTKLRELMRKFYVCQKRRVCEQCPYDDDPSCDFKHEFRELGIEVDE